MSESQAATEVQLNLVQYYVIYATTALAAYEYVITFSQEVSLCKQRRIHRERGCIPTAWIFDFFELAPYVITAAFSALRVYAIWDGNIPAALTVMTLSLVPVAINIYTFSRTSVFWAIDPVIGPYCSYLLQLPHTQIFYRGSLESLHPMVLVLTPFSVSLGARISLILADLTVIVLTWFKTFHHTRAAARIGATVSLSGTLLRDGSVYFIVLLVFNIAQILVRSIPSLQTISPIFTAIDILSPILLSRFLLSLRQAVTPLSAPEDETNVSTLSVFGFRTPTIVGDMGELLDYSSEGDTYVSEEGTAPTMSRVKDSESPKDARDPPAVEDKRA
ncbi:hypothetical protein NM688_g7430 [Phlebia brevispora]|uniref:Uncharacterized protein n=1 Tax=Phlebia brevispora TaxID=194682 RepID=A0ACC1S5T6_9APHY|nr:hypothetical protein NM688_g7430 [Phlebia brevispora]